MSRQSGAKREHRKKLTEARRNKRRILKAGLCICKYSGCQENCHPYKYCRHHRLAQGVRGVLARMTIEGKLKRVGWGVYRKPEEVGQVNLKCEDDNESR